MLPVFIDVHAVSLNNLYSRKYEVIALKPTLAGADHVKSTDVELGEEGVFKVGAPGSQALTARVELVEPVPVVPGPEYPDPSFFAETLKL